MRLTSRNLFNAIWLGAACLTVYLTVWHMNQTLQRCPKTCPENDKMIQNISTDVKLQTTARSKANISSLRKKYDIIDIATDPLPLSADYHNSAFLVILISSHPSAFGRRNAIRGTWANVQQQEILTPEMIRTVFLLGKSENEQNDQLVEKEMQAFGDIVHGSFEEAYRNATYKTLLGFKWAHFHCQQAKYILKADDDVFINLFALTKWLKNQQRMRFYGGYCHSNSLVVRDPNSKWYVSQDDYPAARYPPYCAGGGYVISADVLNRIMKQTFSRKIFPIDDAYVGIMVKELKDVSIKNYRQHFKMEFKGIEGCGYNSLFVAHPVKASEQLQMFLEAYRAHITCK